LALESKINRPNKKNSRKRNSSSRSPFFRNTKKGTLVLLSMYSPLLMTIRRLEDSHGSTYCVREGGRRKEGGRREEGRKEGRKEEGRRKEGGRGRKEGRKKRGREEERGGKEVEGELEAVVGAGRGEEGRGVPERRWGRIL
jgi:hypothetical protein